MADWVSASLGFLERVPKIAFQVSIPIMAIGGALALAIRFRFVREEAFNGYAADAAPVMLVVGVAILVVGLLFAMFDQLRKIPRWFTRRREESHTLGKLLENIRFLQDKTLLVLLDILNQPSCRVPSPGDLPSIMSLEQYGVIEAENFYASASSAGTMLRAAAPILGEREQVKNYIRTVLTQRGQEQSLWDDPQRLSANASDVLRAERELRSRLY